MRTGVLASGKSNTSGSSQEATPPGCKPRRQGVPAPSPLNEPAERSRSAALPRSVTASSSKGRCPELPSVPTGPRGSCESDALPSERYEIMVRWWHAFSNQRSQAVRDVASTPTRRSAVSTRRRFLHSLLGTAGAGFRIILSLPSRVAADSLDAGWRETLYAVADTIVPRDHDAGAVDAGVPLRILAELAQDPTGLALYREGLALVDQLGRDEGASSFGVLDATRRERILLSLATRPPGRSSLGYRFLWRVRRDVLNYYWSSPQGQAVVGYRLPGSGYPEYADPPAGPKRHQP